MNQPAPPGKRARPARPPWTSRCTGVCRLSTAAIPPPLCRLRVPDVSHIGASRLYFASAYRGEGWIWGETGADPGDQRTWLPWLERSAERFGALLRETPAAWLARRVEMIEHEVHHRSQIDAYAGLEGWPVPDIFNRSAESIDALQSAQRTRYRG